MKRRKLAEVPPAGGLYLGAEALHDVAYIPTGCAVLDCVLGGGWARKRIFNLVGDKAVGKTLLAIEACANFAAREPNGKIFYREAEAAFDEPYAASLGLPVDRMDFGPDGLDTVWDTIEDIFEDLDAKLAECAEEGVPGLYIVDSLDALSSRAELDRKPGEASYGLEKQKMLGKLFRQLTRRIKSADVCVGFISQVRDKIGVVFGEKHTRSGGKALDFYASQILWLSHIATINREIRGVKRAVGVRVKAKCKKNKVGLAFRECDFVLRFGYGVDDIEASLDWLKTIGKEEELLRGMKRPAYLDHVGGLSGNALMELRNNARALVMENWHKVDETFAPKGKKYG